jgi:hypothetical protein
MKTTRSQRADASRDPNRMEMSLAPFDREFRAMLADLERAYGFKGMCRLLAIPAVTIGVWKRGKKPSHAARKCVWLLWCITMHPKKIESLWDIASWGLFQKPSPPNTSINMANMSLMFLFDVGFGVEKYREWLIDSLTEGITDEPEYFI